MTYPGNPNCDGVHCLRTDGEVRVLPTGGGGNAILCRTCFNHELAWRKKRNKDLGEFAQFALPAWEDLEIYEPGA